MSVMSQLLDIVRRSVESKAVSITELASACNCSREHIYKLLRGESQPTIPLAEKLAAAVGAEISVKMKHRKKISA